MTTGLDINILAELERDANRSRKVIARALGISEPTLSKRIAQLVEEGIISAFTVEVNYAALGYTTSAITLLKIKEPTTPKTNAILKACADIEQCIEVYTTFGEWDICIRWLCPDNASLMNALGSILNDENIESSETITLANAVKKKRGVPLKSK